MSRIGKLPIAVPDGVDIDFKGTHMTVKGGRGQLELDVHPEMVIKVADGLITVSRPTEQTRHRALHDLTRALIARMLQAGSKGFTKDLTLDCGGYLAIKHGNELQLKVD